VLYTPAHDMLTRLRASRADDSLDRRMLRFVSPDLLIIDDLGLRPLRHDEPIDLYEVIRQRYERGSTIITSNRAIEEWPPLFGDPLMASAAMDRLLHHCQVLELDGNSFRNPPRRTRAATPAPPADDAA
jgi:DNA replication protein DnaC